ncbi:hypothetical protein GTP45_15605 [Pseudoduganella sp. FT55W]|uniref:Uncharacterized protein n=1 Tax=Duganella rivi TaxID=2666083 RepID=A0A7X4GRF6_9BURK|nr:hypothetical protein [Duganella rivi]MYM68246.1 hypothetical protein [Duganella rivi]
MDLSSIVESQPYLSMLKDIVTASAAVFAATVAARGLTTWQRQFRGQQDYTLARQIALAAIKYQSSIDGVRNPFMWFDLKEVPGKLTDAKKAKFNDTAAQYQSRWDAVVIERDILEAAIKEAKVVWKNGAELDRIWRDLFELEKELRRSVFNYLSAINPDAPEGIKEAARESLKNARDILYDMLEEENPDSFKNEISLGVQSIIDWLGPKLMH